MKSLKWKIVSMLVLLVLLALTVSGGMIVARQVRAEFTQMKEENSYLAERFVTTLENGDYENTDVADFFSQLVAAWMLQNQGQISGERTFFLLDDGGNTLYGRAEELTEREKTSRTVINALLGKSSENMIPSVNAEGDKIAEWASVFTIGENSYIILIRQNVEAVRARIFDAVQGILFAIAIGVVLAAGIGFFIAKRITKPLNQLSVKTKELAAGKMEERVPENRETEDELDRLGNNFNNMARALSEMFGALNREKDKLGIIFRYMTDGLLLYDEKGKLLESNPAALALLGQEKKEAEFDDLFAPRSLEEALTEKPGTSMMLSTEQGFLNAVFAPFYNEDNNGYALLVVLQDITERRRVEEMQKEFVGNVSHELRTPITTVKSYVETMLDDGDMDKETSQHFLEVINRETDRMTSLIADLLELSRMDAGVQKPIREEVDLISLLREVTAGMELTAASKGLKIRLSEETKDTFVMGNGSRLAQVFRNLLANAISYGGENNEIAVTVFSAAMPEKETPCVAVSVQDHGVGIEEKDRKRIFERFYRVDKARSRSLGGTGLGLAIVKEIVSLHSGEITVDSEPGQGSTFTVYLPILEEAVHE